MEDAAAAVSPIKVETVGKSKESTTKRMNQSKPGASCKTTAREEAIDIIRDRSNGAAAEEEEEENDGAAGGDEVHGVGVARWKRRKSPSSKWKPSAIKINHFRRARTGDVIKAPRRSNAVPASSMSIVVVMVLVVFMVVVVVAAARIGVTRRRSTIQAATS